MLWGGGGGHSDFLSTQVFAPSPFGWKYGSVLERMMRTQKLGVRGLWESRSHKTSPSPQTVVWPNAPSKTGWVSPSEVVPSPRDEAAPSLRKGRSCPAYLRQGWSNTPPPSKISDFPWDVRVSAAFLLLLTVAALPSESGLFTFGHAGEKCSVPLGHPNPPTRTPTVFRISHLVVCQCRRTLQPNPMITFARPRSRRGPHRTDGGICLSCLLFA